MSIENLIDRLYLRYSDDFPEKHGALHEDFQTKFRTLIQSKLNANPNLVQCIRHLFVDVAPADVLHWLFFDLAGKDAVEFEFIAK